MRKVFYFENLKDFYQSYVRIPSNQIKYSSPC